MSNENEITKIIQKAMEFNNEFFRNELPLHKNLFRISNRMSHTRGYYKTNGTVVLSSLIMLDEVEWHLTLLHELIHMYQHQVMGIRPDHGRTFKNISRYIYNTSKGVYNITRTTEAESELVAEAIMQKQLSRKSNSTSFIVWKNNRHWFIRNLSPEEKLYLISHNYKMGKVTNTDFNPTHVRHCKNITYLIKARYFYSEKVLKNNGLEWKELYNE